MEPLEPRRLLAAFTPFLDLPTLNTSGVTQITHDRAGNLLIAGFANGPMDFDPSERVAIACDNQQGDERTRFLAKYSADGALIWVVDFEKCLYATPSAIKFDPSGNIVIAGVFYSTIDVDPGKAAHTLQADRPNLPDSFVLKLTPRGQFISAQNIDIPGGSHELLGDLEIDRQGNTYISLVSDYLPDDPRHGHIAGILKLDPDGQFLWISNMNALYCGQIELDNRGLPYVLVNTLRSTRLRRLSADGEILVDFGVARWDGMHALKVDVNGNAYVGGTITSPRDFDPSRREYILGPKDTGLYDVIVAKYDKSGRFKFAKQIGGAGHQVLYDLAHEPSGYVHLLVGFDRTFDADPSKRTFEFKVDGTSRRQLAHIRLDHEGRFAGAEVIAGRKHDTAGWQLSLSRESQPVVSVVYSGTIAANAPDPKRRIRIFKLD